MEKIKKNFRLIFQIAFTAVTNGYLLGFFKGIIFKGKSKMICVPGLNCYSCPAALGACPIGSLQSSLAGAGKSFPFYAVGFLIFFGVVFGRFVCGFLCPFGLVQDLLYKIKLPKIKVNSKFDKILRYLKYAVLALLVIIFPMTLTNKYGIGSPMFCKLICPSGTLFGGIPLVSGSESLRESIGFLFSWKVILLLIILVSSTLIYRPFCKYLCPLGGIYGLFNRFSIYSMEVDKSKCVNCKACEKACKMNVEVLKNINSAECIRCGDCKTACPTGCINSGFSFKASLNKKKTDF